MNLSEKLAVLCDEALHLYKEGVFWVAYDQDAYRLCRVKRLQASKKFVKSVGRAVISIGFPSSALDGVLSHFEVTERTDFYICVSGAPAVDEAEYTAWKSDIALRAPAEVRLERRFRRTNCCRCGPASIRIWER